MERNRCLLWCPETVLEEDTRHPWGWWHLSGLGRAGWKWWWLHHLGCRTMSWLQAWRCWGCHLGSCAPSSTGTTCHAALPYVGLSLGCPGAGAGTLLAEMSRISSPAGAGTAPGLWGREWTVWGICHLVGTRRALCHLSDPNRQPVSPKAQPWGGALPGRGLSHTTPPQPVKHPQKFALPPPLRGDNAAAPGKRLRSGLCQVLLRSRCESGLRVFRRLLPLPGAPFVRAFPPFPLRISPAGFYRSGPERSRTGPGRAEPSEAEGGRAERSRAGPSALPAPPRPAPPGGHRRGLRGAARPTGAGGMAAPAAGP